MVVSQLRSCGSSTHGGGAMHEHEIKPDYKTYHGIEVVARIPIRETLRTILAARCAAVAIVGLASVAVIPFFRGVGDPWTRTLQIVAALGVAIVAVADSRRRERTEDNGATTEEPATGPSP